MTELEFGRQYQTFNDFGIGGLIRDAGNLHATKTYLSLDEKLNFLIQQTFEEIKRFFPFNFIDVNNVKTVVEKMPNKNYKNAPCIILGYIASYNSKNNKLNQSDLDRALRLSENIEGGETITSFDIIRYARFFIKNKNLQKFANLEENDIVDSDTNIESDDDDFFYE